MDLQSNDRSAGQHGLRAELAKLLAAYLPAVQQWCLEAGAERWGISTARFTAELVRCAEAKFRGAGRAPSAAELVGHLSTLHLEDLALACACAEGSPEAWEHFVSTYRGYLRACAAAMLKRSASAPEARELADSLFAELYGLKSGTRGSLLRYFHGRSTLKTWLRSVLAQRHVDQIRAGRKFEELAEQDGSDGAALRETAPSLALGSAAAAPDPHRARYLALFTSALQTALNNLDSRDAQRLRMYYAEEKKLAEIGRALGEHESSVSRHLEKVRSELRLAVEGILRGTAEGPTAALHGEVTPHGQVTPHGLSDAELALCFEYAAEDAPIDLDQLFSQSEKSKTEPGGKEI